MRNALVVCLFLAMAGMFAPSIARAGPCDANVYRQYDFFLGNWIVEHKDGKPFARDIVTKELSGCVLWERWLGAHTHGLGYSEYDASRHAWVQSFYMDNGSVLLLTGHANGRDLVFTGDDYPKPGQVESNKVIFRQLPDGVVEEYWTVSTDGAKTWSVAFDGFFHRVSTRK